MRCPYCAFEIRTDTPMPSAWTPGVLHDLARWRPLFHGRPNTLYFGGGTPSRLEVADLKPIIDALDAEEVTSEANPEDLSEAWLSDAIDAGVNRISLGVQTLDPAMARRVGRGTPDARAALQRLARSPLPTWSADLIFALPGQTLEGLRNDLEALLDFGPPHISIYGLTIEPGTGFDRLHQRRPLDVPDEDLWRSMYDHIVQRLERAGLHRYEVSNFAKPGHESRHNRLYWTGKPYLGLGPSAHGLSPDGRRWRNPAMPQWPGAPVIEEPSELQATTDCILSRLRGREGLDLSTLPMTPDPKIVRQLVFGGLLKVEGQRIRLTHEGFPVADAVIRSLVHSLASRTG